MRKNDIFTTFSLIICLVFTIKLIFEKNTPCINIHRVFHINIESCTFNPNSNGKIRDYATMNELICLANLENLNSVFIKEVLKQSERLEKLNKIAMSQMQILNDTDIKYLK